MILGRVVGTVVATRKDERLMGAKLLLVRSIDPHGKDEAAHMVAVDTVDAGLHDKVLVVTGSSARRPPGPKTPPGAGAWGGVWAPARARTDSPGPGYRGRGGQPQGRGARGHEA